MRWNIFVCASCLFSIVLYYAGNDTREGQTMPLRKSLAASPSFTIALKPVTLKKAIPFLQSCAWARAGDKVLLIGGRIEGFHGLSELDTIFNSRKANTSAWVLNLTDFSAHEMPLDQKDPFMLQFFSTSMEFFQDKDTLYLVGGFGLRKPGGIKSNHTFDRMVAIQVSKMIQAVETKGSIRKAILDVASSPFVQVTGGELKKTGNLFYLMFGQKYDTVYTEQTSGVYTSALKKFRFTKGTITDTSAYRNSILHRRDLTLASLSRKQGNLYLALGGVFTTAGDGYQNPIYLDLNEFSAKTDTLKQITNQYDCAFATIYDQLSGTNAILLMGGIGMYQYDAKTKKWEHGDGGELLPFVKSITQIKYQNGKLSQHVQLPPLEAEMPGFIGANAIFFPFSKLLYSNGVIDYQKLKGDSVAIGYVYGGIKSSFPSSDFTPTTINNTVYQVVLYKTAGSRKK